MHAYGADTTPDERNNTTIKLITPGRSWIDLPISPSQWSGAEKSAKLWTLHVRAQKAAVDYRPYQGSAKLRVTIGADEACGPIVVSESDEYLYSADLRSVLLPTGRAILRIALDPKSESQCWIQLVAVSVR